MELVEHPESSDGWPRNQWPGPDGFCRRPWERDRGTAHLWLRMDKPAARQIEDLLFVDGGIETPVEVVQGFQVAEVRQLGAALHLALLPDVEFVLTDQFEELGMAQTVGGGFLQSARPAFGSGRRGGVVFRVVCRAFMLGWGLRLREQSNRAHSPGKYRDCG